jgi:hypothetical protein
MNANDSETSGVDPARLLKTARRLFTDHDLRPSVVMAQTAIEVATENLLAAAFEARHVAELREPISGCLRASVSPTGGSTPCMGP